MQVQALFRMNRYRAGMDLSLQQLRGFVAVAEELHYGRAAQRLNLTQPPLTRQIQGLERTLGVRLFDRTGRGVRLTAAGDVFLEHARRVLALLEVAAEPPTARPAPCGSRSPPSARTPSSRTSSPWSGSERRR